MQNRIVEIATDGAYLHIHRGFLCVSLNGQKAGQVAIDDISALIVRGHGASLSVNACSRLAEANIPVVICGSNQSPCAVVWPVAGHYAQGLHMQAQAVANKPLLKRLWAQLVREKILAQAQVLQNCLCESGDLHTFARLVRSGDPENHEAQAARKYWQRLFGKDFRRDQASGGINSALNYGYTVLRAAVARAILAAGLHPSLSIHHQSRGDALRLADDLMEPFRPWVDYRVKNWLKHHDQNLALTPELKADLAAVLQMDFSGPLGASPMHTCIERMAQSLVQVFKGEARKLHMPQGPLPLFTG